MLTSPHPKPRVLLCHNYYKVLGGECLSYAAEKQILESAGFFVREYNRDNHDIDQMSKVRVAREALWNPRTYKEVRALVRNLKIDIVHCTNTFPLITTSVYDAARAEGASVVQALRNYRFLCAGTFMMRDGKPCGECVGAPLKLSAIKNGCYRNNRIHTAVSVLGQIGNNLRGVWHRKVDQFYTPSQVARKTYVEAGFPADRISVKPNFLPTDPGLETLDKDGSVICAGRVSQEKGVTVLLEAWNQLDTTRILRIVGDGALRKRLQERYPQRNIQWLGFREPQETLQWIGRADALVVPSLWNETFGRTVIEAYAMKTPVIASRIGAMAETVQDGSTGLLVEPGNVDQLRDALNKVINGHGQIAEMGLAARHRFLEQYTATRNLEYLTAIYQRALTESHRHHRLA